jgi:hypothetical protein
MNHFYSNQLGGVVVDEMCKCGHLKSEHGSRTMSLEDQILRESNEGSCCSGSCSCSSFSWARFVTKEEVAKIYLAKNPRNDSHQEQDAQSA